MAPLLSFQNCQVATSNKTYTLRKSLKKFAKDRMRSHELSCLSDKDNQSLFSIKRKKQRESNQNKITKIGKNVMNIVLFSITLHCRIQSLHLLLFKIKVACICISKIMFILSAYISLYIPISQI